MATPLAFPTGFRRINDLKGGKNGDKFRWDGRHGRQYTAESDTDQYPNVNWPYRRFTCNGVGTNPTRLQTATISFVGLFALSAGLIIAIE